MKIQQFPQRLGILCSALALSAIPASAVVVTITAARDTAIFASNPNNNFGSTDLVAGAAAGGQIARSLLSFDVAATVPAGSTINSITFQIGVIRQSNLNQASSYQLHRFLDDWTEGTGIGNSGSAALAGQSTWINQFHNTTPWNAAGTQAGTEFIAAASAIGLTINDISSVYQIASTAALVNDVQGWLDNPAANDGWIFRGSSEGLAGTARRFSSTEVVGTEGSPQIPQIIIDYTLVPEPGTACLLLLGVGIGFVRRRA